jgi:hypothetical protein
MHAHTEAIGNYARTTTDLADELAAAVTLLSRDLGPALSAAFGPVGDRFAAAFNDATTGLASTVAAIGDDMTVSGAAAAGAAVAFGDAEQRSRDRIVRVGM